MNHLRVARHDFRGSNHNYMTQLTLVRVPEGDDTALTKRITAEGSTEIPQLPFLVQFSSVEVADTAELLEVLEELGAMPDVCVIRAEPLEPDDDTPRRRLINPDKRTGDAATLRAVPRDWVLMDFDSVPAPAGLDFAREPQRAAQHVRGLLPECFRVASCVWRASSSAGLKPGIRIHLWFLLTTAVDTEQLKLWLGGVPVDHHVFGANHPHFTAHPHFDSRPDPMSARLGVLDGDERVIVPTLQKAESGDTTRKQTQAPLSGLDPFTARALRQWEADHPSPVASGFERFDCPACESIAACAELPDGKWFCHANGHKDRAPTIGNPTRTPGGTGYVGHRFEFVTTTAWRDVPARLVELGYRKPAEVKAPAAAEAVIDVALADAAASTAPTVKELDRARRELAAAEKVVRATPSQLAVVAEQLGKLCPSYLDADAVRATLVRAAVDGAPRGLALTAPAAEATVDKALAAGAAKPKLLRKARATGPSLQTDEQGNLLICYANVLALCSMEELATCVVYDERSHRVCCSEAPWMPYEDDRPMPRRLDDADLSWIVAMLAQHFDYPHATTDQVHRAMCACASERLWDPVRDYFCARTWDGSLDDAREFLGETAIALFGCTDNVYSRAVFTRWCIATVQRTFEPGCMFRQLLVLVGSQDLGKSTVLRNLCADPAWFCDTVHDFGSKDSRSALDGKLIVELAELDKHTLGDKYDAGALKSFISTCVDSYRRSYARIDDDFARRCVFAATSNVRELLRDPTGNSRFNVLDVTRADHALAALCRDDVWAAAKALYDAGEPSYLQGEEKAAAAREQAAHYAAHPVEELVGTLWSEPIPGAARGGLGSSPLGFDVHPDQVDGERMLQWVTSSQLQDYLRKRGLGIGGNTLKIAAEASRSIGLVRGRVSRTHPAHPRKWCWGRPESEFVTDQEAI